MNFNPNDVTTWPIFLRPAIIAHDIGHTNDRSTAVVGGNAPHDPKIVGITELHELSQGLLGAQRAMELAVVDRRHGSNALIIADLSNDESYAEVLYQFFGPRVFGVRICASGNGTNFELWTVNGGYIPVFNVGRSYLFDNYASLLSSQRVRIVDSPLAKKAHQQLADLQTEYRQTGKFYACPPGQHDDLGITVAMLAWASQHPMLQKMVDRAFPQPPPPRRDDGGWAAHT
jgi:hypothetical protein